MNDMAGKPSSPETFLIQQDNKLAKLIAIFGNADIGKDKREPFDALARAVIGQQLSTAAAGSITKRIESIHGKRPFKPARFLALGADQLKACGISNSKIKTVTGIAEACIAGDISHQAFAKLDDGEVLQKLTSFWGVGTWTAEIFMMYGLNRLDTLALGDGGLIRAHKILYPNSKNLETTSQKWRPYRAVAAWYLWRFLDNPDCHKEVLGRRANV
jgi:DNA-3-methyladenine glycosylase II